MRNIIQNIEAFNLLVIGGENKIPFPKNFSLTGKFINRIHILTNSYFVPFDKNTPFVSLQFLFNILITLRNKDNKIIFNNVPAGMLMDTSTLRLLINDVVDWNLSEIKIINNTFLTAGQSYSLPMAFEYETTERSPISKENLKVYRLFIPRKDNPNHSYRLLDYNVSVLEGKKIVKIICNNNANALLSLYDKKTGKIVRIPFPFLSTENAFTVPEKTVWFENLQPDFGRSRIETLNNYTDFEIIFYYE